jgi:hypothetical protein
MKLFFNFIQKYILGKNFVLSGVDITDFKCCVALSFLLFLFFSGLLVTTEAMGIWRFAGAFAVVERQSECGSKTC